MCARLCLSAFWRIAKLHWLGSAKPNQLLTADLAKDHASRAGSAISVNTPALRFSRNR